MWLMYVWYSSFLWDMTHSYGTRVKAPLDHLFNFLPFFWGVSRYLFNTWSKGAFIERRLQCFSMGKNGGKLKRYWKGIVTHLKKRGEKKGKCLRGYEVVARRMYMSRARGRLGFMRFYSQEMHIYILKMYIYTLIHALQKMYIYTFIHVLLLENVPWCDSFICSMPHSYEIWRLYMSRARGRLQVTRRY